MIIFMLFLMYPDWKWDGRLTVKFTYLEMLLIDLPLVVYFGLLLVKSVGG